MLEEMRNRRDNVKRLVQQHGIKGAMEFYKTASSKAKASSKDKSRKL